MLSEHRLPFNTSLSSLRDASYNNARVKCFLVPLILSISPNVVAFVDDVFIIAVVVVVDAPLALALAPKPS